MLHERFTTTADFLAKQTDFGRRARQGTGSVFALLETSNATLDDFADFALVNLHGDASPQAFYLRFRPLADICLPSSEKLR